MKHDWYTRFVLTVIAACLVILVVQTSIPPSYAANGVAKIALCDVDGKNCVDVVTSQDGRKQKGIRVFTN